MRETFEISTEEDELDFVLSVSRNLGSSDGCELVLLEEEAVPSGEGTTPLTGERLFLGEAIEPPGGDTVSLGGGTTFLCGETTTSEREATSSGGDTSPLVGDLEPLDEKIAWPRGEAGAFLGRGATRHAGSEGWTSLAASFLEIGTEDRNTGEQSAEAEPPGRSDGILGNTVGEWRVVAVEAELESKPGPDRGDISGSGQACGEDDSPGEDALSPGSSRTLQLSRSR